MKRIIGTVLVATLLLAVGCKSANYRALETLAEGPQMPDTYTIGARDVVTISYRLNPELNQRVVIGPHGKVDLELVGEVRLAGLTATEASALLTEAYREHFTTPDVRVAVVTYASKTIYMLGEVARQGPQVFDKPLRLMDVFAASGGIRESAKLTEVHIIRPSYDNPEVFVCSVKKFRDGGDMMHNPVLQDQDIVYVPPTGFYAVGYKTREIMFPITSIISGLRTAVSPLPQ